MSLRTLEELETVIRYDATTEAAYASTFNDADAARWRRMGLAVETVAGEHRCRPPKDWIVIRRPQRRTVSAERRAALAEAMTARNQRQAS